jgi:hypothetical protein
MDRNQTDKIGTQVVDAMRKSNEINAWRLCVAPMLDWTDKK